MSAVELNAVVAALGLSLAHFLWQGFVIAALLELVLAALRERSSTTRYAVRCLALVAMATAPVATFALVWTDVPPVGAPSGASRLASGPATTWPFLVVYGWSIGASLLSVRLGRDYLRVRRLQRTPGRELSASWQRRFDELAEALGVRAAARVVDSAVLAAPTVIGWLRPVVLMPARVLTGLTSEQIDALLAHELAHVRRHDYLVNLVQSAIEVLLFYHPAVWWVSRGIRDEREFCCDDVALRSTADPIAYARALTTLEGWRSAEPEIALSTVGGSLMQRIQRLLGRRPDFAARGPLLALLVLLSTGLFGASAFAGSAHDDEAERIAALQARIHELQARIDELSAMAELARLEAEQGRADVEGRRRGHEAGIRREEEIQRALEAERRARAEAERHDGRKERHERLERAEVRRRDAEKARRRIDRARGEAEGRVLREHVHQVLEEHVLPHVEGLHHDEVRRHVLEIVEKHARDGRERRPARIRRDREGRADVERLHRGLRRHERAIERRAREEAREEERIRRSRERRDREERSHERRDAWIESLHDELRGGLEREHVQELHDHVLQPLHEALEAQGLDDEQLHQLHERMIQPLHEALEAQGLEEAQLHELHGRLIPLQEVLEAQGLDDGHLHELHERLIPLLEAFEAQDLDDGHLHELLERLIPLHEAFEAQDLDDGHLHELLEHLKHREPTEPEVDEPRAHDVHRRAVRHDAEVEDRWNLDRLHDALERVLPPREGEPKADEPVTARAR